VYNSNKKEEEFLNNMEYSPLFINWVINSNNHAFLLDAQIYNKKSVYSSYTYNYLYENDVAINLKYANKSEYTSNKKTSYAKAVFAKYITPNWHFYSTAYKNYVEKDNRLQSSHDNDLTATLAYVDCCKQVAIYYNHKQLSENNSNNEVGIRISLTTPNSNKLVTNSMQEVEDLVWGYKNDTFFQREPNR
jgi:hypothetical protein